MNNSTTGRIEFNTSLSRSLGADLSSYIKLNVSISILLICINLMAAILHSGGLYLLLKVKETSSTTNNNGNMVSFTNTRLLIMLSITDLSASLFLVIERLSTLMDILHISFISFFIVHITAGLSLSTMYLITLNRLVSTVCSLWYRRSMTKTKFVVVTVLVCVVVAGSMFGNIVMIIFHLHSATIVFIGGIIFAFVYDLYFVFCVFTYIAILITISKSRRNLQVNNDNDSTSTTFQFICATLKHKGYITPFLITLTYMVFVIVPFIAMMTCTYGCLVPAFQVWYVTFPLNNMSDALIYIFFDREIRNHLKKTISRRNTKDKSCNDTSRSLIDTEV